MVCAMIRGKQSNRQKLIERLDAIFSMYIRLRDSDDNGYFHCISCGLTRPWSSADCGHYYSRSNMSIRWDEDNAHAECVMCNRFSPDHLAGYERNLVEKIGQERVDALSVKAHSVRKWSEWELEELIKEYQSKVDDLRAKKAKKLR